MIKVVINAKKGYISVEGHADYAPIGQDIVCAGVSAIVNGMYLYFYDLQQKEIANKLDFVTKLEYGGSKQFEVKYDTDNLTNIVVVAVFAKMFTQFKDYPEYVKIKYTPLEDKTVNERFKERSIAH